jgi:peptide deformylase
MSIRKVARLGHPVLRQVARPIPPDQITSDEVKRLVQDLMETMVEYEGVGLAAPQIFESVRAFVMYVPPDPDSGFPGVPMTAWINPRLTVLDGDSAAGWEGCLSIPDLRGKVERPLVVEIAGYGADGVQHTVRYEGFPAVVAQHEFDHLEGIVFLDRMQDMSTLSFLREYERYWHRAADDDDDDDDAS